jgi:BexC/CtrB/KpsE family polysaccharide export inner-membrane protein
MTNSTESVRTPKATPGALTTILTSPARLVGRFKGKRAIAPVAVTPIGRAIAVQGAFGRGVATPANEPKNRNEDITKAAERALILSFVLMVVLPTLLMAAYFFLIASDRYVAETRLSVRAASDQKQQLGETLGALGKFLPSAKTASLQDAYMIVNYIKSRPIIDDIGGPPVVEAIYARDDADFWTRLARGQSAEEVWKYWGRNVYVSLDSLSGIVTVKVLAFSPQDALDLAQKIVDASEKLVNQVSMRSRNDAVAQAARELESAKAKLVQARLGLTDYRNRTASIDPIRRAEDIGKLILQLEIKRQEILQRLAPLVGALSANSPSVRPLRQSLEEIDRQIAEQKQKMTSGDVETPAVSGGAVSEQIAEYERLKLDEIFAEKLYQLSESAYDRTLQESRKQQLYLSTVVKPTLPQKPLYPERATSVAMILVCFFIAWGLCCLLAGSVLDHLQ